MVGLHSFCSTLRAIKDFWIISSAQLIYHSFRYQILLLFCLRLASFSNTTQRLWLLTRLVMMMKSTVKLIVLVAMREFKHISSPVAPIIGTLIICSSISPSSSPFDKCGEMVALSPSLLLTKVLSHRRKIFFFFLSRTYILEFNWPLLCYYYYYYYFVYSDELQLPLFPVHSKLGKLFPILTRLFTNSDDEWLNGKGMMII